jgi:3-hydroxyisobutyrate dehydrogenase-like beta-hydroxyacid dehydrogenase
MSLTVAIVAAGNMGAGIGQRLTERGATVLTSLVGRSKASAERAAKAGMRASEDAQLLQADIFLSIIPPGEALALAQRFAPLLERANKKPVYVECNAVNPRTMTHIGDVVSATGAPFVGGCIIGPPPVPGSANTKLYVSGPTSREILKLNDYGLIVRLVEGSLTAASALKMSYAGITKGFTALAAAMMLAATREGSAEALKKELGESQAPLQAWLARQIPAMYGKAYRWVAELDEVSGFVGEEHPEHEMFAASARLYERLAADLDGNKDEIGALDRFVQKS